MSKIHIDNIIAKVDEEIARVKSSPEEMKKIVEHQEGIGDEFKPVYGKVTRKTFHDLLQVAKHKNITIGELFTKVLTEASVETFEKKKPYDPEMDYKAMRARNQE